LGQDEEINDLFGKSAGKNSHPSITKILVRDLEMTETWKERFLDFQKKGRPFTEEKTEIVIDRMKGSAQGGGLRNIERVPSGVAFSGSIVVRFSSEKEKNRIKEILQEAFQYLENDALGGEWISRIWSSKNRS